jgi:hypothetical protein
MEKPSVDLRIERVRVLYVESDVPMREIATRTGVHLSTIKTWVKRYAWPARGPRPFGRHPVAPKPAPGPASSSPAPGQLSPPSPAAPPVTRAPARPRRKPASVEALVDRLKSIITHQIELMESRMSEDDQTSSSENPERDARALGNLVRSVEKLKELEPDHSKRDAGTVRNSRYPLSPGEEEKLRDEIVERLLRLRERLRNSSAD